jgi:hypothetical protein
MLHSAGQNAVPARRATISRNAAQRGAGCGSEGLSLPNSSRLSVDLVRDNLCIYPARFKNQAHSALADEDPTTWFDKGKQIEEMLAKQNNLKVEYGSSPDLRFACTLTVQAHLTALIRVSVHDSRCEVYAHACKTFLLPNPCVRCRSICNVVFLR